MPIHVFFDNSNIIGGARAVAARKEPGVLWAAVRLHFANLFALIENGRDRQTAVLAGSVPPSCVTLWEYARSNGYETDLLKRVEVEGGGTREQGVDEVLHLKIANAIIDFDPPQTLVVVTGDGHESNFGTGFPTQIKRALKNRWDVEVWSWTPTLSGKYSVLQEESGGLLRVKILDDYYDYVTFVQSGEFFYKDESGEKIYVDVAERHPLPLS